jgi:excinuclease ABC subunit A
MYFEALAKRYHFKLSTPIKDLSEEALDALLYGTKGEKLELKYDKERGSGTFYQPFEGIVRNLERRYMETQSQAMRAELEQYMSEHPCPDCGGKSLKKETLAVTVAEQHSDFSDKSSLKP